MSRQTAARFCRALAYHAQERDTLLLVIKSTVAAAVAWVFANDLLGLQMPAFAPFSAVLVIQTTVSQSMMQSVRYVVAIVAGVVATGVIGSLLGPHLWSLALIALLTLVIGRWRRLGSQGSQVVTAGPFAYTSYISTASTLSQLGQLGGIVVLVLLGAVCGVVCNVVQLPPMRYRSADRAVANLALSLSDLFSDVAEALGGGVPSARDTDDWLYRARQFDQTVQQARSAVRTARESTRWNPRRWLLRQPLPSFTSYERIADRLGRVSEQLRSISRVLDNVATGVNSDEVTDNQRHYLRSFGQWASYLARACATSAPPRAKWTARGDSASAWAS